MIWINLIEIVNKKKKKHLQKTVAMIGTIS